MSEQIQTIIDQMLKEEMDKASNYAKISTLQMRVLLKLARYTNVSLQSIYETKDLVLIDPSVSHAIEKIWKGESMMIGLYEDVMVVQPINEKDMDTLQDFLSKNFVKPIEISNMVSVLKKRLGEEWNRELWCLFAVDGLVSPKECFENYSRNLSIPVEFGERVDDRNESPEVTHVRAIRTLYRDVNYACPERIGAVLKNLLKIDCDTNSVTSCCTTSDSSDDETEDKFIISQYKKLVGKKLHLIACWIQEKNRIQKEVHNKKRKRPIKKVIEEEQGVKRKNSEIMSETDDETSGPSETKFKKTERKKTERVNKLKKIKKEETSSFDEEESDINKIDE